MRKIKFLAVVTTMLFVFLLSAICVSAEILPVKNAWILHDDCIVVLRENGDLLLGDSIDTQTPKLLAQNVKEFKGKYGETTFGEHDSFTGIALHDNGDVTEIMYSQYGTKNENADVKKFQVNAERIYFIGSMAYLNKNHELVYTYNTPINSFNIVLPDIKKVYDTNVSYDAIYAISTNDILCKITTDSSSKTTEKTEILTDVKDFTIANNDLIVLRNNGDLYFIHENDTPNRIGVNVGSLSKVAYYDTWTDGYPIDYVNENGEYFSGTSVKAPNKYLDNVRDVYIIGDNRYIITNDNIIYSFGPYHWGIDTNSKSTKLTFNAKEIYLDKNTLGDKLGFVATPEGYLCSYSDSKFITQDIKDVVTYYDNNIGADVENYYLFIKENGELLGAFDKPQNNFITSFSQKQTIVKINKKEIELTAKIQMVDNRSMYPFRECLENMGATVLWDATNQIAIGEYNGITIEFPIGKNEYYINGVRYEMDTKAYVDESIGRTYIPIRYAAEGLGFTVDWIEGELENVIDIYK